MGNKTLRVEMLLKNYLANSFTSEPPIAVEYERRRRWCKSKGAKLQVAKAATCTTFPKNEDLLLLCEKWHIFVARDQLQNSDTVLPRSYGLGQFKN